MNLVDLLNMPEDCGLYEEIVKDSKKEDKEEFSDVEENSCKGLRILNSDLDRFYTNPDFKIEVERILNQLDTEKNNTYAVYDKDTLDFIGISESPDEENLSLKRNSYSVFNLLVYGFTKKEIIDILHISRSYVTLLIGKIKGFSDGLRGFYEDIYIKEQSFTMF